MESLKPTKIKFCGITDRLGYRSAVELQADYVGFIFYSRSPRAVTRSSVLSILDRDHLSRSGQKYPQRVGVFVNQRIEEIITLVRSCGLAVVQIHGDEDEFYLGSLFTALKTAGLKATIWKALRLQTDFVSSMKKLDHFLPINHFLLEKFSANAYGGTGEIINVDLLAQLLPYLKKYNQDRQNRLEEEARFVLAGGLKADNLAQVMEVWKQVAPLRPSVLDFNSGVEDSPGIKDFSLMQAVVRQVREIDRNFSI